MVQKRDCFAVIFPGCIYADFPSRHLWHIFFCKLIIHCDQRISCDQIKEGHLSIITCFIHRRERIIVSYRIHLYIVVIAQITYRYAQLLRHTPNLCLRLIFCNVAFGTFEHIRILIFRKKCDLHWIARCKLIIHSSIHADRHRYHHEYHR